MNHRVACLAALPIFFAGAAAASPCGDKIAALEKKLNDSGAATGSGTASAAANARTVKSRQVIEDAKGADARGDAKGCDATLEKALRETGSAQQ